MSPSRRFLTISILISLVPSSIGITCHSCEGKCKGDTCEGQYCVRSYYNPKWGNAPLIRERVMVKGCLNGSMLAENVKPHCLYNTDSESDEMCICNTDKCNSGMKLEREEREKVTCKCTKGTKGCEKNGECKGDFCTWTKSVKAESKPTMGCMDYSLPLLERRAIDSCMLPPMLGSMHYLALGNKDLINTESCICSSKNCNKDKPFESKAEWDSQLCPQYVRGIIKGTNLTTIKTNCIGEFCYKIAMNAEMGQIPSYEAGGCATFMAERQTDPLFSADECMEYNGKKLKMRACYKTKDKDAIKRLEESIGNEEEEREKEDYEEEEITIDVKETVKAKNGRTNGKKEETRLEEEEEEEEKKEKEEVTGEDNGGEEVVEVGVETATSKKFVFVAPTNAPAPDESNATMITVFVLIILCICVAGITWKFQLHRKLMRGNYDTVAGG